MGFHNFLSEWNEILLSLLTALPQPCATSSWARSTAPSPLGVLTPVSVKCWLRSQCLPHASQSPHPQPCFLRPAHTYTGLTLPDPCWKGTSEVMGHRTQRLLLLIYNMPCLWQQGLHSWDLGLSEVRPRGNHSWRRRIWTEQEISTNWMVLIVNCC